MHGGVRSTPSPSPAQRRDQSHAMVAVAHPGPSRMKIEIVALLPGSSALLYLWLVNRKNLNKNPVTLMNADKTRINADKMEIISAWVAECPVKPTMDIRGELESPLVRGLKLRPP